MFDEHCPFPERQSRNAWPGMRWLALFGASVSAMILIMGCATPTPERVTKPNTVIMANDNKFNPAAIEVPVGTTITWENISTIQHTVTFDPATAIRAVNVTLPPGAQPFDAGYIDPRRSYSHQFDVPGVYKYTCVPHEQAGMLGTVIVK